MNALPSLILLSIASLYGCSSSTNHQDGPPSRNVDVSQIPNAVPRTEPRSRYGNPDSYVVFGKRYHVMTSSKGYRKRGIASWYGSKFHGRRTSSGEPYDMHAMTAAHKTLPLPTYVRVTNLKNGRQIVVKVNDRGPFHDNRIIDLSHTAAVKLGIKSAGTGWVEVEALTPGTAAAESHSTASRVSVAEGQALASGLYLQLGAFINAQNAERLKSRLSQTVSSSPVIISSVLKDNQQFYRVRIGPIEAVEQVDSMSRMLVESGFNEPKVIIE